MTRGTVFRAVAGLPAAMLCIALLKTPDAQAAGAPRPLLHAALASLSLSVAGPSLADLPQRTAEPSIMGPATKSCTVTLMQDKQFRNTAYPPSNPAEPDRNFSGSYAPPADCPGPWAKIVLEVNTKVDGVQFDRLLDVYLGGALFLSSSTSEPCCVGKAGYYVHWTAQRDVSRYAALLSRPQPVAIDLGNVVDSTYTGIYVSTATLRFYQVAADAPEAAHPDQVIGVHSQVDNLQQDGYYQVNRPGQVATQAVNFPGNLVQLHAELFAQGHGACEEFWWSEPSQCSAGTPYREVAVYLDGRLAGAAPVYPVTFTGASGPGLWEPIPSPRAWNLRPYEVDLTPFVGSLTDGAPHQVGLAVLDASYPQSDVWDLAANLLAWVDRNSTRTSGALISAQAAPAPSDNAAWDRSGMLLYTDHSAHSLDFSGWVQTSGGRVTSIVHEAMSADSTQPGGVVQTKWDWTNSSSLTTESPQGAVTSLRNVHETYGIASTPLTHFGLMETRDITSNEAGQLSWSAYQRSMETSDATGIAWDGVSSDIYRYTDSGGACVDHTLGAAGGFILADYYGSNCQQRLRF